MIDGIIALVTFMTSGVKELFATVFIIIAISIVIMDIISSITHASINIHHIHTNVNKDNTNSDR